jgi:coenzyme F420-0:L-glutamate ligase/coenzyme F420-1:gamma-L-glutamate ligase
MQLIPLYNIPLIKPGADLAWLIFKASQKVGLSLTSHDIVVVTQKVISKIEERFVHLAEVTPSTQAYELAERTAKPPALVEVILWDTIRIVRAQPGLLIVETRQGFICANAGVDSSNVTGTDDVVLRLPADPDFSARHLRWCLSELTGAYSPILIIDSQGRPWRKGIVGQVIGLSGLAPIQDLRGTPDLFGRPLRYTEVGLADQIAAAATLVMGQAAEGCPVVIVRGLRFALDEQAKGSDALRPPNQDLFR